MIENKLDKQKDSVEVSELLRIARDIEDVIEYSEVEVHYNGFLKKAFKICCVVYCLIPLLMAIPLLLKFGPHLTVYLLQTLETVLWIMGAEMAALLLLLRGKYRVKRRTIFSEDFKQNVRLITSYPVPQTLSTLLTFVHLYRLHPEYILFVCDASRVIDSYDSKHAFHQTMEASLEPELPCTRDVIGRKGLEKLNELLKVMSRFSFRGMDTNEIFLMLNVLRKFGDKDTLSIIKKAIPRAPKRIKIALEDLEGALTIRYTENELLRIT